MTGFSRMPPADSPIDDLRRQIDEIDDALHDLLMRRTEVAAEIGAVKGNDGGSGAVGAGFLRPGREAMVLRRLVQRHRGLLPAAAVVRIWRELMSAVARLQGPLAVAIPGQDDQPGFWDLARDHFGSHTPISAHETTGQVLRAVIEGRATVGVLPLPQQDDRDPWWRQLMIRDAKTPRIIARLPFGTPGTMRGGPVEALAVGRVPQERTGRDRSLFVLESTVEISRSALGAVLKSATLEVGSIHLWHDPHAPATWLHLIEVEGFLAANDPRLVRLAKGRGNALRQLCPLGGYAVPFSPAELGQPANA